MGGVHLTSQKFAHPPPTVPPHPPQKKLFPPTKSQLPTQNSMLILILIDVHYSQKAAFSFAKGLNCQYHSSLGSLHPVKKSPPSKISNSNPPTPPLTVIWKTLKMAVRGKKLLT